LRVFGGSDLGRDRHAIPSRLLGAVEGRVGRVQQRIERHRAAAVQRHTPADRHRASWQGADPAGLDRGAHALDRSGGLLGRQIGQQDAEFLAADARDPIGGAKRLGRPRSQVLEHNVAHPVSPAIVDLLEVVGVEHGDRKQAAAAAAAHDGGLALGGQPSPVPQAGQRIDQRSFLDRPDRLRQHPRKAGAAEGDGDRTEEMIPGVIGRHVVDTEIEVHCDQQSRSPADRRGAGMTHPLAPEVEHRDQHDQGADPRSQGMRRDAQRRRQDHRWRSRGSGCDQHHHDAVHEGRDPRWPQQHAQEQHPDREQSCRAIP
jgi:hypothetical protein